MNWGEIFTYEESTGLLFWKYREGMRPQWNSRYPGTIAGSRKPDNCTIYMRVSVNNRYYFSHRIIYEMHYGEIPEGMVIDHIDGNGENNFLSNIRLVDRTLNSRNQRRKKGNTSGVAGIYWREDNQKWRAMMYVNGQYKTIGSFGNIFDAVCARKSAELNNGYTTRHGR